MHIALIVLAVLFALVGAVCWHQAKKADKWEIRKNHSTECRNFWIASLVFFSLAVCCVIGAGVFWMKHQKKYNMTEGQTTLAFRGRGRPRKMY